MKTIAIRVWSKEQAEELASILDSILEYPFDTDKPEYLDSDLFHDREVYMFVTKAETELIARNGWAFISMDWPIRYFKQPHAIFYELEKP